MDLPPKIDLPERATGKAHPQVDLDRRMA